MAGETVAAKDGEPVKGKGDVEDIEAIRHFAVAYLRHEQDMDLTAFGVKFDQFYLESSLYKEGRVEKTVAALVDAGKTYEQDGALWLRTTDDGDDKDRVMKKSDGTYTYFVPDVAYHVTKWERGYTKVINIQGSDHHGTIARVRAGLQGLGVGIPKGYPDYVLHKMVTVMRDGQEVKISKRAGSYVTVRDLIEWSGGLTPGHETAPDQIDEDTIRRGRDAVRFFLISRKADTEFVFDIDLALKQNDENPVYYVQYAHARICTILNDWKERYAGDLSQAAQGRPLAAVERSRDGAAQQARRVPGHARPRRRRTRAARGRVLSARSRWRISLVLQCGARARGRREGTHRAHRAARGDAPGPRKRSRDHRRFRSSKDVIAASARVCTRRN